MNRKNYHNNTNSKLTIKALFTFDDIQGLNFLIISNVDDVYGCGSNYFGSCGLGHNNAVVKPQIIQELCRKSIKNFYNGSCFVVAMNNQNHIYVWGTNNRGELGRGYLATQQRYFKPQLLSVFSADCVQKISVGSNHTLALTQNGTLFGWGDNTYGQIGTGKNSKKELSKPKEIKFPQNMKKIEIYCFDNKSFALTQNGSVFRWGLNENFTLGYDFKDCDILYEPQAFTFKNIRKIQMSEKNTYFLNMYGHIFAIGLFSKRQTNSVPVEVKSNEKFETIHAFRSYSKNQSLILSFSKKVPYLFNQDTISKVDYRNFAEYHSIEYPDSLEKLPEEITEFLRKSFVKIDERINKSEWNLFELSNRESNKNYNRVNSSETKSKIIDMKSQKPKIQPKLYKSKPELRKQPKEQETPFLTMNQVLNHKNFSHLKPSLKTKIKAIHIYEDDIKLNILFITSDDLVYNSFNMFDGSHKIDETYSKNGLKVVEELCHKNIKMFFNGYNFVFAMDNKFNLYGFGQNNLGQLARGHVNSFCDKFEKVNDLRISNLCCGARHCLALSLEGEVFGWGDNSNGQVGCGNYHGDFITEPIRLGLFDRQQIVTLNCTTSSSFALTSNGLVYSWGSNENFNLGLSNCEPSIFQPKLIEINKIKAIGSNDSNLYILNSIGQIYWSGKSGAKLFQKPPLKIQTNLSFKYLESSLSFQNKGIIIAHTNEQVYVLLNDKIERLNTINIIENYLNEFELISTIQSIDDFIVFGISTMKFNYFSKYSKYFSQSSLASIRVNDQIDFAMEDQDHEDSDSSEENHKILDDRYSINSIKTIPYGKYDIDFEMLGELGSGTFGTVFKVREKSDQREYAIKKIKLENIEKEDLKYYVKEIEILSNINSDKVVKYESSWREDSGFIYIKMELCDDTLKNILSFKLKAFNRKKGDPMNSMEYFLSCELFKELLECVKFLHDLNPRIIHRDLKASNVLIVKSNYKYYLKICDFGLATLHEKSMTHTHNIGTPKYIAPEVIQGERYDWRADIYSLGIIVQELFDLRLDRSGNFKSYKGELRSLIKHLEELFLKMIAPKWRERPHCGKILEKCSKWAFSIYSIKHIDNFNYEIHWPKIYVSN